MTFAYAVPWWGLALAGVACVLLARAAYTRTGLRLPGWQWGLLVALRTLALAALVICLLRPVAVAPPGPGSQGIVALVVDGSHSMGIADADGLPRVETARRVARQIAGDLGREFRVDVFAGGERLERMPLERLEATRRRSELDGAVVQAGKRRFARLTG